MEVLEEAAIPESCFPRDVPKDLTHAEMSAKKVTSKWTKHNQISSPDYIHTQVLEKLKCEKVKLLNSLNLLLKTSWYQRSLMSKKGMEVWEDRRNSVWPSESRVHTLQIGRLLMETINS